MIFKLQGTKAPRHHGTSPELQLCLSSSPWLYTIRTRQFKSCKSRSNSRRWRLVTGSWPRRTLQLDFQSPCPSNHRVSYLVYGVHDLPLTVWSPWPWEACHLPNLLLSMAVNTSDDPLKRRSERCARGFAILRALDNHSDLGYHVAAAQRQRQLQEILHESLRPAFQMASHVLVCYASSESAARLLPSAFQPFRTIIFLVADLVLAYPDPSLLPSALLDVLRTCFSRG